MVSSTLDDRKAECARRPLAGGQRCRALTGMTGFVARLERNAWRAG